MSANMKRPPLATMAHLNALLDEAPEETFPSSEPVSICLETETPQQTMAAQASRHAYPNSCSVERSMKSINNRLVG